MKRVVVSVTSDLSTDQRVHKVCTTLDEMGYEVLLIGRKLPDSLPLNRKYKTYRMHLLFRKKFPFYAEYNLRLFFKLLFLRKDILLANDLDTLLPNFLISRLFGKKLVYDSHELFTEVPELINRPFVRGVWLRIEQWIFPRLKRVYTVNRSIADFYSKKYEVDVKVVRNIAPKSKQDNLDSTFIEKIKAGKKMLILQGNGINRDRGTEEAIRMMQYLNDVVLYIIGSGDIFDELKQLAVKLQLQQKVKFINRLPYDVLMHYTRIADLGLSLDRGTNLNYEYSLPNKVFDYIQAQIPLFVSNRKEVSRLVKSNRIGFVTKSEQPEVLASQVQKVLSDTHQLKRWKRNLKEVKDKYNWENEKQKVIEIFNF